MRLAAIALIFCAVAFGQSAPAPSTLLDRLKPTEPSELLKRRLKSMDLMHGPVALPARRLVVPSAEPKVCAIPLLQALPADDHRDFKIQVYAPPAPRDTALAGGVAVGIPACK